jgi:hypothetical protein
MGVICDHASPVHISRTVQVLAGCSDTWEQLFPYHSVSGESVCTRLAGNDLPAALIPQLKSSCQTPMPRVMLQISTGTNPGTHPPPTHLAQLAHSECDTAQDRGGLCSRELPGHRPQGVGTWGHHQHVE